MGEIEIFRTSYENACSKACDAWHGLSVHVKTLVLLWFHHFTYCHRYSMFIFYICIYIYIHIHYTDIWKEKTRLSAHKSKHPWKWFWHVDSLTKMRPVSISMSSRFVTASSLGVSSMSVLWQGWGMRVLLFIQKTIGLLVSLQPKTNIYITWMNCRK